MKRIDLNVDIGEGAGFDSALLEFASSANVCCGEHAGSWDLTRETIDLCRRHDVRIGAHPGFPDRKGFGRVLPPNDKLGAWCSSLTDQVRRFKSVCEPSHIKPHGESYRLACLGVPGSQEAEAFDANLAALLQAFEGFGGTAVLMEGALARELRQQGVRVALEGFPDRRYGADGRLKPRSAPDALLCEPGEAADQAIRLAPNVDTLCLHGDGRLCVEFAHAVRAALERAGYEVAA